MRRQEKRHAPKGTEEKPGRRIQNEYGNLMSLENKETFPVTVAW